MKPWLTLHITIRSVVATTALLVIGLVIVSCAPNAESVLLAPAMVIPAEGGAIPTPTPPPGIVDLTPEQILAGLPPEIEQAYASANPDNALKITQANGCNGCHSLDPNVRLSGPSWVNLGDTAVVRRRDVSPAAYIYESIVNPSAFVVPDYNDGVMPKTFGETLSPQDLADIIAFVVQRQHR